MGFEIVLIHDLTSKLLIGYKNVSMLQFWSKMATKETLVASDATPGLGMPINRQSD